MTTRRVPTALTAASIPRDLLVIAARRAARTGDSATLTRMIPEIPDHALRWVLKSAVDGSRLHCLQALLAAASARGPRVLQESVAMPLRQACGRSRPECLRAIAAVASTPQLAYAIETAASEGREKTVAILLATPAAAACHVDAAQTRAAAGGFAGCLRHLLPLATHTPDFALEAAAQNGRGECVDVLLSSFTWQPAPVLNALRAAIKNLHADCAVALADAVPSISAADMRGMLSAMGTRQDALLETVLVRRQMCAATRAAPAPPRLSCRAL